MLKKRIIGCVVVKDNITVQSVGFNRYLPVGKPRIAVEFLNNWGIDEIIYIDISAASSGAGPNYDLINELSGKCHVPLAVGGGITSVDQMRRLMECGADKIVINSAALTSPELISEASDIFGNQCIVVSIDAKKKDGEFFVYDHLKGEMASESALEWAREAEDLGAGEIFLTSVDRDGMYTGYELELMRKVSDSLKIPVIASGGAANAQHFADVFEKADVSAASAANFFHFTEHSVITVKSQVEKYSKIRLDTQATYRLSEVNGENRIEKRSDKYLEELLYIKIMKEVI